MSGLTDPTMSILGQALDGLTARQAAITSNLANIDTPNYQAVTVDFEAALQRELASIGTSAGSALGPSSGPAADLAMETNDPRQYSSVGSVADGSSAAVGTASENARNDGNKVDLETEMTALTQTQLQYEAASRLITGKFAQLYTVLGGH
jgi:flagellar basal-body rod protein FlgB